MVTEIITLGVILICVIAEIIHYRRIQKIARLAFGPSGRPTIWTHAAPLLRIAAISLCCWGFLSLLLVVEAKIHQADMIQENEYKHLVLILDVSPSMHLKDAGVDQTLMRRKRASQVLESLFNRVPMRQFKTTVIAVYSDAKPLLEDSKDHEVVRHILEELPMWHAYKPGKTKLMDGINMAVKMSKPWNPGSTFIVMLTDGDTVPPTGMPKLPVSVQEFIVVGVGDPHNGKFIDGHMSRQDTNTLRQISNRLGGFYHDGNQKHLPADIISRLNRTKDKKNLDDWTRREWALAAIVFGSSLFTFLPILLHYFGSFYRAGVPIRKTAQVYA